MITDCRNTSINFIATSGRCCINVYGGSVDTTKPGGASGYSSNTNQKVNLILNQMVENSQTWHTSDSAGKKLAEQSNQNLAKKLKDQYGVNPIFDPATGKWNILQYANGGRKLGDGLAFLHNEERVLTPMQNRSFEKLVDILDKMPEWRTPIGSGYVDFSMLKNMTSQSNMIEKGDIYQVHIDKVETQDANSFVELLPTMVHQYKK